MMEDEQRPFIVKNGKSQQECPIETSSRGSQKIILPQDDYYDAIRKTCVVPDTLEIEIYGDDDAFGAQSFRKNPKDSRASSSGGSQHNLKGLNRSEALFEGGMEPGDLLGAKIMWKRRLPRPFEIVCCDRGYLPLPGVKPYKKYCEIPDCKQGVRVEANGRNEIGQNKENKDMESPQKKAEEPDDNKSISVESPIKKAEAQKEDEQEDEDKEKDEPGWKVVGRCVQNYPQAIADPDKPRLAYWTCNGQLKDCCATTFQGCGRNLCDLHCRKFTDFRKGKKRDRFIMREYLVDYCCYDCLPKFQEAKEKKAGRAACVGWTACIILGVVCLLCLILVASTQRKEEENSHKAQQIKTNQ